MGTQILVRTQGDPLAMLQSVRKETPLSIPISRSTRDREDLDEWIRREPEWGIQACVYPVCRVLGAGSGIGRSRPIQRRVL